MMTIFSEWLKFSIRSPTGGYFMLKRLETACIAIAVVSSLCCASLIAWEDRPDIQDHKETDRIFKLAQKQRNAVTYEKKIADEKASIRLKEYRTSKFKRTIDDENDDLNCK